MGFMDYLLATLSPERAVKTAAARMAIQTLNSGYGNYGANPVSYTHLTLPTIA